MTNPIKTEGLDAVERRSIDYMIRNMQDHHMQLSNMADQKAQILLGVCSIIITVAINQLSQSNFSFGLALLSLGMFATIIPSIIAITPRLGDKNLELTKKKAPPRLQNPLFFGNFADIPAEQFLEEMNFIVSDSDELYKSLFLNVYNNGKVLAEKKYRLLTLSYRLFLVSIIVGVIVSLVELLAFV